jgi:Lrp/AsnC family transcriptional regulator for asnA, asnC and gidA
MLSEEPHISSKVKIDEIDAKILGILVKDARTNLKDIAKDCKISSVAVLKRIKRLKTTGVITGTTLYYRIEESGYTHPATIGINLDKSQERAVANLIRKNEGFVDVVQGIGKYDLCAFIIAKNIKEIDSLTRTIRKHPGIRRISVNLWVPEPPLVFENLDFQPNRDR